MAVYVNNITLNTGEYFSRDFYLDSIDGTPLDLTGYTAASQMRKHPESVKQTADFNVGFIDRANGRIRVSLATTTTRLVKPGRYVWDVMFTEGQGPSSNAGVWSTLDANNSGSYRGFTINAWSSFMNTYAYSRVPQSGLLSSQPDPYGVKTDSYTVNFPYTGAYQIEAAADNVGTVTINNKTFNAVNYNDTNVGVGSISLEKGNHTVTLTQQNTQSGTDNFAENPVGIAVSITYIGGTAPGKKSIVLEGQVNVTPDMSTDCPVLYYENRFGLLFYNEAGQLRANTRMVYGQTGNYQVGAFSDALTDEIKPSQMKDYGVVFAGLFNNCDEDAIDQQFDENGGGNTVNDSGFLAAQNKLIRDNIDTVLEYVNNGGVLVVTGEHNQRPNGWQGLCGNPPYYNLIMEALGVSFRQDTAQSSGGGGYTTASKDTGWTNAPSVWPDNMLVAAVGLANFSTVSYLNTNTDQPTQRMYSGWFYQNIGFGAVVMILDSNYFGNSQNTATFDVGLEHPNVELYGMFRSLVKHTI